MEIFFDIYAKKEEKWMKRYNILPIKGRYGNYYSVVLDNYADKKKLEKKLKYRHIRYRCYEKRYSRSFDYRQKFITENPPPYKCRYCNKDIDTENMVVDHVIPISKVKNTGYGRNMMNLLDIKDINDTKNLVPSCIRCNMKKDNHIGFWPVKAALGKYKTYWVVHDIALFIFFVMMAVLALYVIANPHCIGASFRWLIKAFKRLMKWFISMQ